MHKKIILSAIGLTLLGSVAVLAQGQPAAPQKPMTFFIAGAVPPTGNLGGIAGADRICQNLAMAVGAGNNTRHAYLSPRHQGHNPPANPPPRTGPGPSSTANTSLTPSTPSA